MVGMAWHHPRMTVLPSPSFPPFCRTVFQLAALLGALHSAQAQEAVTVGDPSKPGDLPQALLAAHSQGATDITIAPGTYEIPESAPLNHITFEHWHDTTIHAADVTIVFDGGGYEPLRFSLCKSVTWDGGAVGFSIPAATQGRVTRIQDDPTGSSCDWQIDAGYPVAIDPKQSTYDVVDASTRKLRVGTGDWTPESFERLPTPGAFRLRYRDKPGFQVGDWLVTRAPHGNMTAHLDHCETCTLENLTLFN